jgi:hypothetical protein
MSLCHFEFATSFLGQIIAHYSSNSQVGLGVEKRGGGDRTSIFSSHLAAVRARPGAGGGAATTTRQCDSISSWPWDILGRRRDLRVSHVSELSDPVRRSVVQ